MKKLHARSRYVKNYLSANLRVAKNSTTKGLRMNFVFLKLDLALFGYAIVLFQKDYRILIIDQQVLCDVVILCDIVILKKNTKRILFNNFTKCGIIKKSVSDTVQINACLSQLEFLQKFRRCRSLRCLLAFPQAMSVLLCGRHLKRHN